MGKKGHGPRGNAGGPKKPAPASNNEETNYIVFSNSKEEPKAKTKASSSKDTSGSNDNAKKGSRADGTPQGEEQPKKPDTRTLIGGASWTGKLPMNILAEHCQKQKWDKPDYSMMKTADGFFSAVTLRKRDPKTQEVTILPQIRLPDSHKQLGLQPSAVEARHFAATYTLFRIRSMQNIHMMLPPAYRDLWKGDFQALKEEDILQNRGWIYEADPFAAKKTHDDEQAQKAKHFQALAKEKAARAEQANGLGGANPSKGWKNAPKVEMGKSRRKDVEALIRNYGVWNPNKLTMPTNIRVKIIEQLVRLGFRKSHVEEASETCKDKEEILEWLLIHVPEDDLPRWSLPEGYVAGVSMASGNIKREAAIKRLTAVGYAAELCEEAYDACQNDEVQAAERLQYALLGESLPNFPEDGGSGVWNEEQEVVKSIYGEKCDVNSDFCLIRLEIPGFEQEISLGVRKPHHSYPESIPILSVDAKLPAYIRLSIIRQALQYAKADLLGEQMVLNLVNWSEQEISGIIERPGKLSDVASVATAAASSRDVSDPKTAFIARKRHPKPISWQPGTTVSQRLFTEWEAKQNDPKQKQMITVRQSLPAWKLQESIVHAVQTHQVTIISGETGSGKSTQSVQFILDDMIRGQLGETANIICTQPRRISALGLADRVADERCSIVGREIGYSIRGDSKQTSGVTKITFVTTGVLLRRLQTSGGSADDVVAALADVSHVVVDEVHERTLDTDFLLALLRDVLKRRKDLKVILMSATLDANVYEQYFGGPRYVGRVEIQGRTHPVDDFYVDDVLRMTGFRGRPDEIESSEADEPDNNVSGASIQSLGMGINYNLIAALVQQIDKELSTQDGGILIFLPGTMEINRTLDALRNIPNLHALPLHASLMPIEQRRVFPPPPRGKRKVIAATNVAETSITIEDIVAVIDTGRVKETMFDVQRKVVKLEEVWASRAACKQRRGRAGRVRAGKCYKLYTRNAETKMLERPDPEIRRVPLEQLCLSVKSMGVVDVQKFLGGTLTPPETLAIEGALELLRRIGALDGEVLTALGRHLSMIPADLRCGKLMVYGATFGCLEASVTIASILTARSPFVSPRDKRAEADAARLAFAKDQGDVICDLNAYDAWVELRSTSGFREARTWCNQNFLSFQTLNDITSTRAQYLASLKEIGFIPMNYSSSSTDSAYSRYNRNTNSSALLCALIAGAFSPQTARIQFPDKKYTSTISGAMELDPEAKTIKYFTEASQSSLPNSSEAPSHHHQNSLPTNNRVFIHPSSTLFSTTSYATSTAFLSFFTQIATSKLFIRDLTPCSAYGLLLFGGSGVSIDLEGRGLVVDGWARLRGWARIGVLVGRLRGVLDSVLEAWVENPGDKVGHDRGREDEVVRVVRKLVELDGMDR